MEQARRITEAEWQVMRVLWQQPGASAQEVIGALEETTDWSPATIKTLLHRLINKGTLAFEKIGKTYYYHPRVTEEQCRAEETESFLDRVFGGSLAPMLLHLVKTRKLSKREMAELERILREEGKK